MKTIFTTATFTPAEAEAITGVSVDQQRTWRNRGFFPKFRGHARFDVFALARLVAVKALSLRGIGPDDSKDVAGYIANGMVASMAHESDFWSGDAKAALTWQELPELPTREVFIENIVKEIFGDLEDGRTENYAQYLKESSLQPSHWKIQSDYLKSQFLRSRNVYSNPYRFFVWWADGTPTFALDLTLAFNSHDSSDPKASGAAVVLDLDLLTGQIFDRCNRAFVDVEFPRNENGELIAPIEYGAAMPFTRTPQ
ncbi:MAG TPA: hypothetical protein DIU09_09565 [Hyphomonadaceae bacterium]|nr:hypothetical protein AEM38_08225 [Hyphomonadaceae bacterium UKL13-1]HCP64821.1 hypothetical protein [Hyphomonadaceae bacterium]